MPTRSKIGRVTHVRSKRQARARRPVKSNPPRDTQKQKQKQTVNVYVNDSPKRTAKRTARSYPDRDRRPQQQRQQQSIRAPQPPQQFIPIPMPQQNTMQHHDLVRMMETLKESSMKNLSESLQRQQSHLAEAMNEALESRINELQSALYHNDKLQPKDDPLPPLESVPQQAPSSPEPRGEPSVRPKPIRDRLRETYTHDQMKELVKQHMKAHPKGQKVSNYDENTLIEFMVNRPKLHKLKPD